LFLENGGVSIVEMLYTTNLLALVGSLDETGSMFSPRRLTIWNTNNSTALCEISFLSNIIYVKMNKQRLIVSIREKTHIYDITTMKLLQSLDINNSLGE
jgi:autophagy-related protein 18